VEEAPTPKSETSSRLLLLPDPGSLTVGAYLERWLNHTRSRVRPSTHEGYAALLRCHVIPTLGPLPLAQLHPLHLQDLYAHLLEPRPQHRSLASGTVRNLHLALNNALNQAVRWQLLASNPAGGAQPPRPRRAQPTIADPTLLQTVLDQLQGHPVELPAVIAITTGMRRGEIVALRWSDLSPDRTQARIQQTLQATNNGLVYQPPKTHRSRRAVVLPAYLKPHLNRQERSQAERRHELGEGWQTNDLIVDRGDGGPLHPDSLSSAWRRFLHQRKLPPIRFHDLRHSHATLTLAEGIHPKIVSERLGHASIGITLDTYSHVLPTMQTQAADTFDRVFQPPTRPPPNQHRKLQARDPQRRPVAAPDRPTPNPSPPRPRDPTARPDLARPIHPKWQPTPASGRTG
jgi:integrase